MRLHGCRTSSLHTLRVDLAQQVVAGFYAAVAGFGTQRAVLVLVAVAFTMRGALLAGVSAGLDLRGGRRLAEGRLARQHAGRGIADVGTVEIGTDAAAQVGHIVFGETGIGTGGAVVCAVEAGFDTGDQLFLDRQRVRMPVV